MNAGYNDFGRFGISFDFKGGITDREIKATFGKYGFFGSPLDFDFGELTNIAFRKNCDIFVAFSKYKALFNTFFEDNFP